MIDIIFVGLIFGLFCLGVFLAKVSSGGLALYLWVLDIRYWSPWVWLGVAVALVGCLLWIHIWWEKQFQPLDAQESDSQDTSDKGVECSQQ